MKKNHLSTLAALALGGALLSGCAGQSGVAASVDDTIHTNNDLAALVSELSPYLQAGGEANSLLANLIMAGPVLDSAKEFNVGVGVQDAAEFLDTLAVQSGNEAPSEWSDSTLTVTRMLLLLEEPQAQVVWQDIMQGASEQLEGADIDVNPRYGEWTGTGIASTTSPWLQADGAAATQ